MAANRDGTLYEGAFGRRALPDGAAVTAATVFWIAPMTKAITSAAAMQLVGRGKLVLDEPIANIPPELAQPQVLEGFDETGELRLRPTRRAITLRHLITHTSGFVYDMWNPEMGRHMERKGIPGIITCRNAALDLPLVFDPGDAWDYGIGIDWVGKGVKGSAGSSLASISPSICSVPSE
jgi:methyl acetate hydrolase